MKKLLFTFFVCIQFSIIYAQSFDFKYNTKTDLNSDGVIDEIMLKSNESSNDFVLTINGKKITGNLGDQIDGMVVVDINKSDKFKEIAVHSPGPSDDDVFKLYWYNGTEIIALNELSRWPEFPGNGIVYVKNWEGFWTSNDKYRLDNTTRKLIHVEQFAYYIGLKITIKKGFKIFKEKDLKNEVALLNDNSEIEIILCDKKGYDYDDYKYLIKSGTGLLGWSNFKSMEGCIDLPMAD